MVSLEMFRMSETYMMKGENLAPPAAVVDFLPSHDSADLYGCSHEFFCSFKVLPFLEIPPFCCIYISLCAGAAWLYTLSNGYPAGRDPVQPNKQTGIIM